VVRPERVGDRESEREGEELRWSLRSAALTRRVHLMFELRLPTVLRLALDDASPHVVAAAAAALAAALAPPRDENILHSLSLPPGRQKHGVLPLAPVFRGHEYGCEPHE
jgi:hypothetical protein